MKNKIITPLLILLFLMLVQTVTSQTNSPEPCKKYTLSVLGSQLPSNTVYVDDSYSISCDYGKVLDCIELVGPSGCSFKLFEGTHAIFDCKASTLLTNIEVGCKLKSGTQDNCCSAQPKIIGNLSIITRPLIQSQLNLSISALNQENKTVIVSALYMSNSQPISGATCSVAYSDQPLQQHTMTSSQNMYRHSKTVLGADITSTVTCSQKDYSAQSATISLSTNQQVNQDPRSQISVILESPVDFRTEENITFQCRASGTTINEVSLYTNTSGVWKKEETKPITNQSQIFQLTGVGSGTYIWNCEAGTSSGLLSFAPENQFFDVILDDADSSSVVECNAVTDCTEWEPDICPQNQTQARVCQNVQECGYPETESCTYIDVQTSSQPIQTSSSQNKSDNLIFGIDSTILIIVVVIVAILLVVVLLRRRNSDEDDYDEEFGEGEQQNSEENRSF